jgi:hypothetical protein
LEAAKKSRGAIGLKRVSAGACCARRWRLANARKAARLCRDRAGSRLRLLALLSIKHTAQEPISRPAYAKQRSSCIAATIR